MALNLIGFLNIIIIILTIVLAFLLFYRFYFLRNPKRKITQGNNIISPADGRITIIRKFDNTKRAKNQIEIKKWDFGKIRTITHDVSNKGYIVSIFMSIFDVHYNKAPIDGIIKSTKHTQGKFYRASTLKSTFENENFQILIQNKNFKLKMIQIAGFIARRIVPFIKEKDHIIKGQNVGFIKLGSQVTLILPETVKLKINKGDRVMAGKTIIAELPKLKRKIMKRKQKTVEKTKRNKMK